MGSVNIYELTPEELLGGLGDVHRKNAPEKLYLAGDLDVLRLGPRVSVVGSRRASTEGLARTRSLSRALVERGMVVVSGLAEGIDTAAHETAIEADGRTIAVLGTPLDRFYPKSNKALQERMMRDQLVVSQFQIGRGVGKSGFVMRNRTMALLTDATVIVEAGETSGTRHQGWEALRLGRVLFILESVAKNTELSWPSEMIAYGAQVLTRENLGPALAEVPHLTSAEELTL